MAAYIIRTIFNFCRFTPVSTCVRTSAGFSSLQTEAAICGSTPPSQHLRFCWVLRVACFPWVRWVRLCYTVKALQGFQIFGLLSAEAVQPAEALEQSNAALECCIVEIESQAIAFESQRPRLDLQISTLWSAFRSPSSLLCCDLSHLSHWSPFHRLFDMFDCFLLYFLSLLRQMFLSKFISTQSFTKAQGKGWTEALWTQSVLLCLSRWGVS